MNYPTIFRATAKTDPTAYVMEAMRAMVLDGWDWGTIFTGVWVAGVILAVLPVARTCMYRRQRLRT